MAFDRVASKQKPSNLPATLATADRRNGSSTVVPSSPVAAIKNRSSDGQRGDGKNQVPLTSLASAKQTDTAIRKPPDGRKQQFSDDAQKNKNDDETDAADDDTDNEVGPSNVTLETPAPQTDVASVPGDVNDASAAEPNTSPDEDDDDRVSDTTDQSSDGKHLRGKSHGSGAKRSGKHRKLDGSLQSRTESGAANANENAHLRENIAKGLEFVLQHELVKSHSLSSITSHASMLQLLGESTADSDQNNEVPSFRPAGEASPLHSNSPRSVFSASHFDLLVVGYLEVVKASVEDLYDIEITSFHKLQLTGKGFDLIVDIIPQSDSALLRLREAERKRVNDFNIEWYNKHFVAQQNKAASKAAEVNNARISEAADIEPLATATPTGGEAAAVASNVVAPVAAIPTPSSRTPSTVGQLSAVTSRNVSRSSSLVRDLRRDTGVAAVRGSSQRKLSVVRKNPSVVSSFRKSKSRPTSAAHHRKTARSHAEEAHNDGRMSLGSSQRQPQTVSVSILNAQNSTDNRRELLSAQLKVGKFLNEAKFPVTIPIATRFSKPPHYGVLEIPYDRLHVALFTSISDNDTSKKLTTSSESETERVLIRKIINLDGSLTTTTTNSKNNYILGSLDEAAYRQRVAQTKRELMLKKAANELSAPFLDLAIVQHDEDDDGKCPTKFNSMKRIDFLPLPYSSSHVVMMTHATNSTTSNFSKSSEWKVLVSEFGSFYALFHRILRPYAASLGISSVPPSVAAVDATKTVRSSSRQSRVMALEATTNTNTMFWSFHSVQTARQWLAELLLSGDVSDERACLAENALNYCARELACLRNISESSRAALASAMAAAAAAAASVVPTPTATLTEKSLRPSTRNNSLTRNNSPARTTRQKSTTGPATLSNTSNANSAATAVTSSTAAGSVRIARGIILGYLNTHQICYQFQQQTETTSAHSSKKGANKHNASDKGIIFSDLNDLTQCHVGYIVEDVVIAISCLFDLADEQKKRKTAEATEIPTTQHEVASATDYCSIVDQFVRGYTQGGATLRGEERVAIKPLILGWEAMNCVRKLKHENESPASVLYSSGANWKRLELLVKTLM